MKFTILVILILTLMFIQTNAKFTNKITSNRMLLVLSAPSVYNRYYRSKFQEIVNFQINYAKAIMGNDNVVVVVDKATKKYYDRKLPQDVLIVGNIQDIWMRDFTTVNPIRPVQFKYTASGGNTPAVSRMIQNSFNRFIRKLNVTIPSKTNLMIDGGNMVDNYHGKYVTSTKFLKDNNLSYAQAKKKLTPLLGAKEISIIEPDDKVLGHSDGMVMWGDEHTLLVNDYSDDKKFQQKVMNELKKSLSNTDFVTVPVKFDNRTFGGFSSACGINLNSVLTFNNLYVPVFTKSQQEEKALKIIKQNTDRKVIEVDAKDVCIMGGSVRCLTWQVIGQNAKKIILAARNN